MADITAYPIIFSAPMVCALLDGRKTQTRRLAKRPGPASMGHWLPSPWRRRHDKFHAGERPWLWVRETCSAVEKHDGLDAVRYDADQVWRAIDNTQEAADQWLNLFHYRDVRGATVPSIHMPKWASRISLRVTDMRIERLQDISVDDAWAEGVERKSKKVRQMWLYGASQGERSDIYRRAAKWEFQDLWDSIHGAGAWDANPEVVVTEFEVHQQNIGSVT